MAKIAADIEAERLRVIEEEKRIAAELEEAKRIKE